MRRFALLVCLLLMTFLWKGHLVAENNKPSSVKIERVQLGDTLVYVVNWKSPTVGKKQLPIASYEIRFQVGNQSSASIIVKESPATVYLPAPPIGDTIRKAVIQVRSIDTQGNVSAWADSPKFDIFSEIMAPNPPTGVYVEPTVAFIWLAPDDPGVVFEDGVINMEVGDSIKLCGLIQYENGARGLDSSSVGRPGCERQLYLWNKDVLRSLVQSLTRSSQLS